MVKHKIYKKFYLFCSRLGLQFIIDSIPDYTYLRLVYYIQCRQWININNPKTYNEKLQWLKLYDRKDYYHNLVDKYEVKKIIKRILGKDYVIPTIGIYNNFNEIRKEDLPNQFVIKCTHDSGSVIICQDKNKFDWNKAKKDINKSLKYNYYGYLREWPYKNIKPRILIEKCIFYNNSLPIDYKFFCFDGEPKMVMVAIDRNTSVKTNFYDMNFNLLPLKIGNPNFDKSIEKPLNFEKMISIAKKISHGLKHIRVDLYNISGHIYFGEITFYHWGGISNIEPKEWNIKLGEWIDFTNSK